MILPAPAWHELPAEVLAATLAGCTTLRLANPPLPCACFRLGPRLARWDGACRRCRMGLLRG